MPVFVYSAKDNSGGVMEGSIDAASMPRATEQLIAQGLEPVQIQLAAAPPDVTAEIAAMSTRPALVDLSQPAEQMHAAANSVFGTSPVGAAAQTNQQPLEPWQRGGALPQPPSNTPQPTIPITLPTQSMGAAALTSAHQSIGGPNNRVSPLSPASSREVAKDREPSIAQRFNERVVYPIFSGVILKEMAPFYRQFATLINAGLSIHQSLIGLEGNTQNKKLKEVARQGHLHVQSGGKISEVMASYPWIFPPMHTEMIRAAEMGGMLDDTLKQVAGYVEHEIEIRRMISSETFYPKMVLFAALMIMGKSGFMGMPAVSNLVLGGMGKSTYGMMDYLNDTVFFGLEILVPIWIISVVFRLFFFNNTAVREAWDRFKLSIPVLGKLIKMFTVAKFLRVFSALYRTGFAMGTSMEIAAASSGNSMIRKVCADAVIAAERGGMVSVALRKTNFFEPLVLDMFHTGETTGKLDVLLDKMADYYEAEGKSKAHIAALIFSTMVLLLVGIMVGMTVVGFYMGHYSSVSSAGAGAE